MAGFGMDIAGVRNFSVYKLHQSHHPGIWISVHLLPKAQHYRGRGIMKIFLKNVMHFKIIFKKNLGNGRGHDCIHSNRNAW